MQFRIVGRVDVANLEGDFLEDGNIGLSIRTPDGKPLTHAQKKLACTILYRDGKVTGQADFVQTDGTHWRAVLPVDPDRLPVLSIRLGALKGVEVKKAFRQFLDEILPATDEGFERLFIRGVQRYGNPTTQYHVSRQISRFFTGARAYRAAACVVMAYKAVELNHPALQHEALAEIDANLAGMDECPITRHPRTNREHLVVSLLCAKWHLELSLGQTDALMATLAKSLDLVEGQQGYFSLAFNLSHALLVHSVAAMRAGRADIVRRNATTMLALFKRAVADADERQTLLAEIQVSHRNMMHIFKMAGTAAPGDEEFEHWLVSGMRVRGGPRTRLIDSFLTMSFGEYFDTEPER